jgi:hypothetical protein
VSGPALSRPKAGRGSADPDEPRGNRPIRQPRTGDLVGLTAAASVQFGGDRATLFKVIRVDPRPTYAGWVWLIGYTIDEQGNAIERREVFVQIAGLVFMTPDSSRRPA